MSHYHRLLSWLKCCSRGVQLCGLSLGLTVMFARDTEATPATPPWSMRTPPWSTRPGSTPRTQQWGPPPPDRPPDSASEMVASSPCPGRPPPPPVSFINRENLCKGKVKQKIVLGGTRCPPIFF